jgi:hypothetical protein
MRVLLRWLLLLGSKMVQHGDPWKQAKTSLASGLAQLTTLKNQMTSELWTLWMNAPR